MSSSNEILRSIPPSKFSYNYMMQWDKPEVVTDSEASCGRRFVPLFGVPEALLSDRGANMLFHLMKEL